MLSKTSRIPNPTNPHPSFFVSALPTNVTPKESKLIIERKIPTGKTLPNLLNSLTPPGVRSLTPILEKGAGLPMIVSPNTKNTHIGMSAILVAKKNRSIHFIFSEPTTSFLKNLRIAQTIPRIIPTK